jgi:flagellar biosynthetic protein FlhB
VAEDNDPSNRTEEATPRKLEEARRKGDVAKSPDLPQWMSLAAACGVILVGGGMFATRMTADLLPFIAQPHEMIGALESGDGADVMRKALWAAAPFLGAILFAAAAAGAAGNIVQHGFLWTTDKLRPDFNRVSPMQGFKRIFGIDGFVAFLKTLLKVGAVGAIAWAALKPHAREFENLAAMGPAAILPFTQGLLVSLMTGVLAFLGVTAGVDWLWQRLRFAEKMKMSREELKEDFKQSDGDPHVKARLRQIRIERSRRRMMQNVPKATVVITNPTHYAVALRYVQGETAAPLCVAKGVDTLALKIREIAGEHEVPILEDPPLARALYATVDVDETIPREHFEAVAKVIGFVMNPRNKGRRTMNPAANP